MKLRYHLLQEALPIYQVGLGTLPLGSPSFLYFSVSAQSTSCGQSLRPHLFTSLNLMSLAFQSPGLSMRPAYGVIRKRYELSRMTEKHSWGLVNITVWLCLYLWSLRIYFRVNLCNPVGTLLIKLVKYFHFAHHLWHRLSLSLNSPWAAESYVDAYKTWDRLQNVVCEQWIKPEQQRMEEGGNKKALGSKLSWALSHSLPFTHYVTVTLPPWATVSSSGEWGSTICTIYTSL